MKRCPLPILTLGFLVLLFLPRIAWAKEASPRPRIALVLSGGSAFGIAHVGVLEEIEAAGIPIDMVVGTSMGSIVGGLYAAGYSPGALGDILAGLDWTAVFADNQASAGDHFQRRVRSSYTLRLGIEGWGLEFGEGLIAGQSILSLFSSLTAHIPRLASFDDLPVPYRAVATDLMNGDKVILSRGSLAEAMRASMSIPGMFRPYEIDGRVLVDGGVVDNLPVDVARALGADIVIAVESRGSPPSDLSELKTPLAIAGQTANLMILQNMVASRAQADLFIQCDLRGFTTASYQDADRLIERGRAAGQEARPRLLELARRISASRPLVLPEEEPNRRALGPIPALMGLRVEGGTPADEVVVRKAFSALVGRRASREELKASIDGVYASGRFDLVRLSIDTGRGVAEGIVSLEPDFSSDQALFLGLGYAGVFSSDYSSAIDLGMALFLQDLWTRGSSLLVTANFANSLRLRATWFQGLGPFYLQPWLGYLSEYDSLSFSSLGLVLGSRYRSAGAGLWAGLALGRDSDLVLGYAYQGIASQDFPDTAFHPLSSLRLAVSLDGRDASAFPERGMRFSAAGTLAGGYLGGEISYFQTEIGLDTVLRLGRRDSLGLALFMGTDLAGLVPGFPAPPSSFYSTLRRPGMFYGYSASDPRSKGDHALGLGLEWRRRISRITPLLGRLYLFGNASLGATALEEEDLPSVPLLWCLSAGFQARLSPSLGLQLAASLQSSGSSALPLAPALSLEFSSFLQRPEDRR